MIFMTATFKLPESIAHDNVEAVLVQAVKMLSSLSPQEVLIIDCKSLQSFDSSALSILLSIQRHATEKAIQIQLQSIPEKLASLAKVYGLAELVLV